MICRNEIKGGQRGQISGLIVYFPFLAADKCLKLRCLLPCFPSQVIQLQGCSLIGAQVQMRGEAGSTASPFSSDLSRSPLPNFVMLYTISRWVLSQRLKMIPVPVSEVLFNNVFFFFNFVSKISVSLSKVEPNFLWVPTS